MSSIFLSHNWHDKPFVRDLGERLKQEGVTVWIDEAEINIGHSLVSIISKAIQQSEYVAAIISPNSVSSNWVTKELSLAMDREIKGGRVVVLPLLIAPCDLPPFLQDKLYADFTRPENFEQEFQNLLRAIRVHKGNSAEHKSELEHKSRTEGRKGSLLSAVLPHRIKLNIPRPLKILGIIILVILATIFGVVIKFRSGVDDRKSHQAPDNPITLSQPNTQESPFPGSVGVNGNGHQTESLNPPEGQPNNSTSKSRKEPIVSSNLANPSVKERGFDTKDVSKPSQAKTTDPRTKVSVRLAPVYYLGNRRMQSIDMPVTLITSAGRFTKKMGRSTYMQFDNVPCGEAITIIVSDDTYNDGMFAPATYKRQITCEMSVVNLGALVVK